MSERKSSSQYSAELHPISVTDVWKQIGIDLRYVIHVHEQSRA